MKKLFLVILLASTVFSSTAFAYTENHTASDPSVALDKTFNNKLVIEASDDFAYVNGKTQFILKLSNAQWDYSSDTGSFASGIEYSLISSEEMLVKVDTALYDAKTENIDIPISAKVKATGVAYVEIDPMSSPVGAGAYKLAHSGYPVMDISIAAAEDESAFDMVFTDDYPYSTVNGRIIKLELNNGFVFTGKGSAEGTGKFKDKAEFSKYSDDTAYVSLSSSSDASTGTIILKNIGIEPTEKSVEGDIDINIKAINTSGFEGTIKLGTYTPSNDKEILQPKTQYVEFMVGNSRYYSSEKDSYTAIDDKNVLVTPFIDENERIMLPVRAVADSLNIKKVEWNDKTKTVTLKNGKNTVEITIGKNTIIINGEEKTIDTSAVIKNSRTFLPVRAIANAIGIADEDIYWNSETKKVTIYVK